MTAAERAANVRRSTHALIQTAGDRAMAAVALALDDSSRKALTETEARGLVARLIPALVPALARALGEDVPLLDACAALQVSRNWLVDAATKGTIPLRLRRRGRSVYVERRSLDEFTRPEQPADPDPLVRLLTEALSAAMGPARERAEPEPHMTAAEAAAALGLRRKALFWRVTAKTIALRPVYVGRHLRFAAADVRAAATNERKGT